MERPLLPVHRNRTLKKRSAMSSLLRWAARRGIGEQWGTHFGTAVAGRIAVSSQRLEGERIDGSLRMAARRKGVESARPVLAENAVGENRARAGARQKNVEAIPLRAHAHGLLLRLPLLRAGPQSHVGAPENRWKSQSSGWPSQQSVTRKEIRSRMPSIS